MTARGHKELWLAGLRTEAGAFRAAIAVPEAWNLPVPSCPDWHVRDLARHVSSLYHWVRTHANRGVTTAPAQRLRGETHENQAEGLAYFDEQLADLLAVLDSVDPDLPAWNWAPQAKKAAFWMRRMAMETAVHRWDAQLAIGLPEPIESRLAADGVAEVLDTWLPAGRRRGPTDLTGIVHLKAIDVPDGNWYLRLLGDGIALLDTATLLDDDEYIEKVAATATASDLWLAMMGRIPFDVLNVVGEAVLLEGLRTG